jgi:hypothetical protein
MGLYMKILQRPDVAFAVKTGRLSFIAFLLLLNGSLHAAVTDSLFRASRKNTLKINPTPALVFGNLRNITLSYERMITKDQSLSIQLGYLKVDPFFGDSVGGFLDIRRVSDWGMNAALDYRYYPLKRNKFNAPDGLYIGSYLSYYGFSFKDQFDYYKGDTSFTGGSYSSTYHFVNLGVSLGYQFIFWKWLSLDLLIFGPSLTFSASNWKISDVVDSPDEEELIRTIKEKFNEKFPLLVPFVKPNDGTTTAEFRMLFRYSISIGVHF